MAKKKLTFSTSNLFVIMNMNFFKKFDKIVLASWKSYDKKDYETYSKAVSSMKDTTSDKPGQTFITTNKSNFEQLDEFKKKYDLDPTIHQKIRECQKSTNSCQVKEKKTEILASLDNKKIKSDDIERITQLVNNSTNTVFGCKQEKSTIQEFEEIQQCKVIGGQKRCEYKVCDFKDGHEVILVGKIDGITEDGKIIEVKNRINKNFNFLKDYETPQIMTYMWMNNAKDGFMVVNLKSRSKSEMNVIPVEYRDDYVESFVIPNVERYFKFFEYFMDSEELKTSLLKGDESVVYEYFMNNFKLEN